MAIMIDGHEAERFMKQRTKAGGYRYHTWHWRVAKAEKIVDGWRPATASEARRLNREHGHTSGYAGPMHPSYQPW